MNLADLHSDILSILSIHFTKNCYSKLAKTCRKLYAFFLPMVYKQILMYNPNKLEMFHETLVTSPHVGQYIKDLYVITESELDFVESLLDLIGKHCPNLEMFEMECPNVYPDELIQAIVPHCSRLQCLILPQIDALTDEGMELLNQYCRNITYMSFGEETEISPVGLFHFILNNPSLERIDIPTHLQTLGVLMALSRCTKLTTFWIYEGDEVTDEYTIPIIKNNPRLNNVRFCNAKITQETLYALNQYCTDLEHIDIINCDLIYEFYFQEFLTMTFNIKEITFRKDSISKDAVRRIANHPGLQELHISNVSSKVEYEELMKEFENLDLSLDISYNNQGEDSEEYSEEDSEDFDESDQDQEEERWYAVM